MASQELLDYLHLLMHEGHTDDSIREILLQKQYKRQDIDEAFKIIYQKFSASPKTDIIDIPTDPDIPEKNKESAPLNGNSKQNQMHKLKIVLFITLLFITIAILFLIKSVMSIYFIYIFNKSMISAGTPSFYVFKYYPILLLLPCLSGIFMFIFLYEAFKLYLQSKKVLIISIISLTIFPLIMTISSSMMIMPVKRITDSYESSFQNISSYLSAINLFNPEIILISATLLVLLIFRDKFTAVDMRLPLSLRIILSTFSILIVLPAFGLAGYGFFLSAYPDYKYKQAKNQVSFYIFKPTYIPENRVQGSIFITGVNLSRENNAIMTVYEAPLDKLGDRNKPATILLKQVGVGGDFNLDNFVSDMAEDITVRNQAIKKAKSGQGLVFIKQTNNGSYVNLSFITNVDVLINITSVNTPLAEIMEFAESLE